MQILEDLLARSQHQCELCASDQGLKSFNVPPHDEESLEHSLVLCELCMEGVTADTVENVNHWRCLNEAIWSEHAPVQVMAWLQLKKLDKESWAQDLLSQMYLNDVAQSWIENLENSESKSQPKDSNGTVLNEGDSVTLIKDLDVKGANFTAKRGTVVRNIRLTDDPKFIEGKVNGTQIVLVAAYLKRA
ncbi:MAG: PhnA domain-containing protein [Bacteriovoracaceae bacterium]|jgi:protein PhnA|nr:PhnA domain protein [Halobacteriovoraceae bacterium]MDP7321180.1 PhnA domain-containing protein [Bacteriovoracaceae bacterium]